MKKKGFTLVELLAVIVILAIIAVIATPMILNVIDNAKKGAAESSAYGYVDAVEKSILEEELKGNIKDKNKVYNVSDLTFVNIKGDKPTEGWVQLEKGIVKDYSLKIGNYIVNSEDGKAKAEKGDTVEETPDGNTLYQKYSLGDIVKLNTGSDTTSEWYVIENSSETEETVKLLKAQNIDSNTYAFDGAYNRTTENNSYCLDPSHGCNAYSKVDGILTNGNVSGTVTEDSSIKIKVDEYGNNLSLGSNLKNIGLITKEKLDELGCDASDNVWNCDSAPAWVTSTSYWTQSAAIDENLNVHVYLIEHVDRDTSQVQLIYYATVASTDTKFGIRPVIEVNKSIVN